jgi:YfiH family protein
MRAVQEIDIHPGIRLWVSTRNGGVSEAPFDSLNLGDHVGDDGQAVQENRRILKARCELPSPVNWMNQVHGTRLIDDAARLRDLVHPGGTTETFVKGSSIEGDAAFTRTEREVLGVMTADCFPVMLYSEKDRSLALVHAGWRGLANGIIEKTAAHFSQISTVWLGPGIRQCHFEVGFELKDQFQEQCFVQDSKNASLMLDLPRVIRDKCKALGISRVLDDGRCTYCESGMFFSYRRDGSTGRFATLAWLA